ncbi:MAG: hypothetical protein LBJ74_01595, partial [Heliobacteriaceae bacterium]|nr:hypothetical protein [Heliobacteriaceae bacterium]
SIAFSDSNEPFLASDRASNLPKADENGNPWWIVAVLGSLGLIILLRMISAKVKESQEAGKREVETLRQQQNAQLNEMRQYTAQLTERQSELAQGLIEQQHREFLPQQQQNPEQLGDTLSNLSAALSDTDDEEAAEKIKSWIETA